MSSVNSLNNHASSTPDQLLWNELRSGNEVAFGILFKRYHSTLHNYGCKLAAENTELVADAIQELFIDLWRFKEGLTDDITSVKFYLYRSLRRKIHTQYKRNLLHIPLDPEQLLSQVFIEQSPQDSMIAFETHMIQNARLNALLRQLPDRQLEAITLKYFENFSTEEVAQMMQVSEKSVRNFIYKGLTTLRLARKELMENA